MNQATRRAMITVLARLLERNPLRTASDISEYRENLDLFVMNAVLRLPREARPPSVSLTDGPLGVSRRPLSPPP